MLNGISLLKKTYISLITLLLGVPNVTTTCRKSWPGNLFQLLNLTFDSCLRLNGVITINILISPSILVLWLQNVKTDHEKSWPANVVLEKTFGLILKNKMATIANYFKIIKML